MNARDEPLADTSPSAPRPAAGVTPATEPARLASTPMERRPASDAILHGQAGLHVHDAIAEPHTADGAPRPPLRREHYAHIVGWGADLDRAQRPAVPMERTPPRLHRVPAPQQQPLNVEVLHSNERPGLTPVFGSTVPPRGLSGSMRRLAFKFSENDIRHWLTLLAADRVQVVEGVISDLAHGQVPNIYAEMGGRAELKHNPAGAARKAIVLGVAIGAAYVLWRRNRYRG